MVITKNKSVYLKVLSPAIMHIFNTLFGLNSEKIKAYPKDWVITSINDSVHVANSRHYIDEAIDLRSHNFDNSSKESFLAILELRLGNKFRVILENIGKPTEHFHIQVKKGSRFP